MTNIIQTAERMIRDNTTTIGAICAEWNRINFEANTGLSFATPKTRKALVAKLEAAIIELNSRDPRMVDGVDDREFSGNSIAAAHDEALEMNRAATSLRKDDINTLKSIAKAVNAGDRTLKDIAGECNYYKWQTNCQNASAIYGRLAECKTRKQFAAILETIDFGDTVSQLQALATRMDTITAEVLVVTNHNNLCTLAQAPKHLYATSDMKPSRFDELRAELNAFIYNK